MPGLINTQMGETEEKDILEPGKMLQAKATTFDPETRQVDQKETVAGQLDSVLAKDSPIMDRARTRAMEFANSRGLVNSTMAAQAGEAAVIDAALPIAGADASTHNIAARENMAAKNAALQVGADASNKMALANAGAGNELAMQTLKGEQATALANIEAQYKELMQASDSVAKMFTTAQSTIAAIQADVNTSPEQKQAAINSASNVLRAGLTLAGSISNIDFGNLLNFSI